MFIYSYKMNIHIYIYIYEKSLDFLCVKKSPKIHPKLCNSNFSSKKPYLLTIFPF